MRFVFDEMTLYNTGKFGKYFAYENLDSTFSFFPPNNECPHKLGHSLRTI